MAARCAEAVHQENLGEGAGFSGTNEEQPPRLGANDGSNDEDVDGGEEVDLADVSTDRKPTFSELHLEDVQSVLGPLGFAEVDHDRMHWKEGDQRLFAALLEGRTGRRCAVKIYTTIGLHETVAKDRGKDSVRVAMVELKANGSDGPALAKQRRVHRGPACLKHTLARIDGLVATTNPGLARPKQSRKRGQR